MKTIMILVAGAVLTLPAAGQRDEHGASGAPGDRRAGMAMPEGMRMPLMRAIQTWHPQRLLGRRAVLQLTDQQVEQLTALANRARETRERVQEETRRHFRMAGEAWEAGDGEAASSHAAAGMQSMQEAHAAMLTAASAARAALTAEQRARVQGWLDAQRLRQRRMRPMRGRARLPGPARRPGAPGRRR